MDQLLVGWSLKNSTGSECNHTAERVEAEAKAQNFWETSNAMARRKTMPH